MEVIHDDRTPNDDLPLPHPENDQEIDVLRLRDALVAVDAALQAIRAALTATSTALDQDLTALSAAIGQDIANLSTALNAVSNGLTTHTGRTDNPHTVTAAQVGLGNVNNTSDATKNAAAVTLTNKTVQGGVYTGSIDQSGSVRAGVNAMAALNVDCSLGNYFTKTINGASTFTFSNAPAARAFSFTLELTHTSGAVTWPAAVQWPGGSAAPTLTAGKTHLFTFVTDDGGTRWRGAANINYTN